MITIISSFCALGLKWIDEVLTTRHLIRINSNALRYLYYSTLLLKLLSNQWLLKLKFNNKKRSFLVECWHWTEKPIYSFLALEVRKLARDWLNEYFTENCCKCERSIKPKGRNPVKRKFPISISFSEALDWRDEAFFESERSLEIRLSMADSSQSEIFWTGVDYGLLNATLPTKMTRWPSDPKT